jgi:hypothetical protein
MIYRKGSDLNIMANVFSNINNTKEQYTNKLNNIKTALHSGKPQGDFPYVSTDRLQLIGYVSECKHCFQCGHLRSLCTNPESKLKFCMWGWYTGGLLPDQLCPWVESNPNWRSISTNYFTNRQATIASMVENELLDVDIPQEAYGHNVIGERLFKPMTVWVFGADDSVTEEDMEKQFQWIKEGIGKRNVFKIPYNDIEDAKTKILKCINEANGFGYMPNMYYQWGIPPEGFIQECTKLIQEREDVHNVNIVTRLVHSERIQNNELMNMTWLNRSIWAYNLKNLFEGRTVICVAGGPSLNGQLDVIKQYRDRLVVVCVSTVAEILFKHDIVPDIIGTIDMKEDNIKYLQFLSESQMNQSHFLFEIDAHHKVIDAYKGPKIMLMADILSTPITSVLDNYLNIDKSDIIPKSGTVANMIYNFVVHTNPKEIWLAGYDLCYHVGDSHVHGARLNETIQIIDGNGGKFIKYNDNDHVDQAFEVTTNDGNITYTSKAFKTYLTELNIRVADTDIPTFDLSKTGASKKGVKYISISEAVKSLPDTNINCYELLSKVGTKLFKNKIVKNIIKNPLKGNTRREIMDIHKTKLTYLIRQYYNNDALIHGSIIADLSQEITRLARKDLELTIDNALNKFKGVTNDE